MKNKAIAGYAAALGDLIRLTTIDNLQAVEALTLINISKDNLIEAEVEAYDLDVIFPKEDG